MIFRKKVALIMSAFLLSFFLAPRTQAMPLGTLLYRTSSNGNLYAYNTSDLIKVKNKIISNVYTGHVAMYIGQENGVDYIVEAMPDGIIKTPAKYFINSSNGEKLLGAKIPKNISPAQQIKVVELAKSLAAANLAYDFDFKKQKGPQSGEWTCVGLVEKIYESANITNPLDIKQLQYNPQKYAIDITPDGFDNYSIINKNNDCFSRDYEFSKISANRSSLIPLPELFGFSAGKEEAGERYFFLPLTQFYQDTLEDVVVDIQLESDFVDEKLRGRVPKMAMIFKWSLINNPKSALVNLGKNILAWIKGSPSENEREVVQSEIDYLLDDIDEDPNISEKERDFLVEELSQVKNTVANNKILSSENALPSIKIENAKSNIDSKTKADTKIENREGGVEKTEMDVFTEQALSNDLASTSLKLDSLKMEEEEINEGLELIISKVYASGQDDYVEIYNSGNKSVDLTKTDIRLYKTKTSATPSLMIRLGNEKDADYTAPLIIPAKGRYLVTRSAAAADIKQRAQAISKRSEFTFAGNAYTIYLSAGVLSSDDDPDLLDKVGFGTAKYYEKNPAPEILDKHLLYRKNEEDSNDNRADFALLKLFNDSEVDNNANNNSSNSSNNFSNNINNNSNNNSDNSLSENNGSENNESEENLASELLPLLISQVYATAKDDYIEIYNPNDSPINLKEGGFRLYKTKTSATPSLMIRIGHEDDGVYPGGFIIAPHSTYRLSRAEASDDVKASSQAISTRSEFTFVGDAQTIYLSSGVVSSDTDEDIIDKLGFGAATYYLNSPAPLILDNYALLRKARASSDALSMSLGGDDYSLGHAYNSFNNATDFVLVNKNYQSEPYDESSALSSFCQDIFSQNYLLDLPENSSSSECYSLDSNFYLEDLAYLWHLDECSEENVYEALSDTSLPHQSSWAEGQFSCALKQDYTSQGLEIPLSSKFNEDNFTIMFYYKGLQDNARPEITLKNSKTNEYSRIKLSHYYTDFYNIPNTPTRDDNLKWPHDNKWHLFTWTLNRAEEEMIFYLDGLEFYRVNLGISFMPDIDTLIIRGDNGANLIDELAIFSRALNSKEIADYYLSDQALAIMNCQPLTLNLEQAYIHWPLETNKYSCSRFLGENESFFPGVFGVRGKSLSFFWKNELSDYKFNFSIALTNFLSENVFGLEFDNNKLFHYFDSWKYQSGEKYSDYFPDDNLWHLVVLTYDPYFFRFNVYLDGKLITSWRHFWQKDPNTFSLKIFSDSEKLRIKDVSLWNFCLDENEVSLIN